MLIGLAIVVAVWYLLSFLNPVVPPPHTILSYMLEIEKIGTHFFTTLYRIGSAFALSVLIGLFLGMAMGRFKTVEALLGSFVGFVLTIPATIWAFLAFILFGVTTWSVIFVAMITTFPIVAFSITEGIKSRDVRYDEMADVFGFSRWKKIRRVFLPYLFPYIIGSARSAFGVGVKLIIIAELIGTTVGAGLQLLYYYGMGMFVYVYSYAILLIAIYVVFDLVIFGAIERYATRWKR
ncbi:MAG: ABC transporter permease [Candidatus Hadarchaeum sp.]|uniref:ABC transporter permease n=1 Tax=Candidatus Hadarchaeum sp. TaxID=2883567 RepID=UPI003D0E1E38